MLVCHREHREDFAMKDIKSYSDRFKLSIKRQGRKIKSFIKTILNILNPYGNLIVAIATVTLATITWLYIEEAKQMRLETKRLADISVEQFKIRAYPAFVVSPQIRLESDKLIQTFKITHRGEITAHKLIVQPINVFSIGKSDLFSFRNVTIYEEKTSLDFEIPLLPNTFVKLESEGAFPDNHSIKTLKNLLLFIRFWVPYDNTYSYEAFGYTLKNTDSSYVWQIISQHDTKDLIRKLKDIDKKNTIIENFFADYNYNVGVVSRIDF